MFCCVQWIPVDAVGPQQRPQSLLRQIIGQRAVSIRDLLLNWQPIGSMWTVALLLVTVWVYHK